MPALDYPRLAPFYDVYAAYDADLPFWLEETRDGPGPVLELMAGTGRVTLPLLRQGVPVVATDLVPDMLAELRAKLAAAGLRAPAVCADVGALPFPALFPRVLLPFQGFSELTDEVEQRRALRAVRRVLAPQGRFLCTLHNPATRAAGLDGSWREVRRVPLAENAGSLVVSIRAVHDPTVHRVAGTQRIERFDAAGLLVESLCLPLLFSLPPPERFRAMAVEAGFTVAELWGDYDHSPYREDRSPTMIWVLEAPR